MVAEIGVGMIFSILLSSSIYSDLLDFLQKALLFFWYDPKWSVEWYTVFPYKRSKFFYPSYGPKCCEPVKLQDSFISNVF